MRLDWDTRWEHMQQHSAQHLISAIAENHFGWETTSWEFGLERCNIELHPTRSEQPVTPEALMQLQHMSNELIRTNKPVTVKIVERPSAEPPTTSDDARAPTTTTTTTTVPKGHHGPLRIVSIQDVDDNQCCGTHVSSLSQLQVSLHHHHHARAPNTTHERRLITLTLDIALDGYDLAPGRCVHRYRECTR